MLLVRMVLLALISFLPTPALGGGGSLETTSEVKKRLAFKSHSWTCAVCGVESGSALIPEDSPEAQDADKGIREQISQIEFGKKDVTQTPPVSSGIEGKTDEVKDAQAPSYAEPEVPVAPLRTAPQTRNLNDAALSTLTLVLLLAIAAILVRKAFRALYL